MLLLNLIIIVGVLGDATAFDKSVFPMKTVTSCGDVVLNECWCLDENWCGSDETSDVVDVIAIVDQGNILTKDRIESNILPEHPDELKIVRSEVDAIERNAFDNFTNLKSIDLEGNKITRLPPYVFSKLANLEFLSLNGNGLKGTKNVFAGLSQLKKLDISNNPLTKVLDDNCFFGIPKTCDILIRSNAGFMSIGTNAFGRSASSVSNQDHTTDHKNSKPKSIHTRSAQFDYSYWYGGRGIFEICIYNNTVQRVDVANKNNVTSGCSTTGRTYSVLHLANLGITTFEKGWYRLQDKSKLPSGFTAIGLSNNNISRVTKDLVNDLPPYITWVDLKNNKIDRLDNGTLEHQNIFSVDLNDNLIEEIEDDAFRMPALTQLFLRENRLKNTKFVTSLSPSLITLHLYHNEITEISPNSFSHLKNLRYLDLEKNRIIRLQSQCLLGAKKLSTLILSSNAISTVEKNAFEGLDLVTLLLGENEITNLERGTFRELESLQILSLAKNQLTLIRNNTYDLPDLESLELNDNRITGIETGAAKNLRSLKRLDISNNPIEKLENGALFGLSKVKKTYVHVANVPLRIIQGGVFDDV